MSSGNGGMRWPPGRNPEVIVNDMKRKFSRLPVSTFGVAALVLIAIVLGFNTFYNINEQQEGIILRLGKFTGDLKEPGLNYKIPFIDTLVKVPVRQQLKLEFGFRTVEAGQQSKYIDAPDEAQMLTGDLNVADVEWIVQYRISNAYNYVFKVRGTRANTRGEETLRDMSEAVMREVVGDHSVDEVLTIGRTKIAEDAKQLLQQLCNRYEIGVQIEQVVLQDVNPPKAVEPSFNEVNEAIQERERLINDAWAAYNKAVPKARGVAEQMIRQAEGYELERVNNAKGEAARFTALYQEFRKSPKVTRERLYLETVERLLPKLGDKIVVDEDLKNILPLMNLGGGGGVTLPSGGGKGGEK